MSISLAIDMMGGDNGMAATVPGLAQALTRYPNLRCLLVGDSAQIRAAIKDLKHTDQATIVLRVRIGRYA